MKHLNYSFFMFISIFTLILIPSELFAQSEFWIIHSNDRHGYVEARNDNEGNLIGGAGVEATIIKSLKLEARLSNTPCLLIDCGDFFQGTPLVNMTKGKVMVDIFNAMGYHFVTFGNHEFDYGWKALKTCMERSNFLWVSSTVDAPSLSNNYLPWLTYNIDGTKIAFLGATTPTTPDKQLKERIEGITFHAPVEKLKPLVALLKQDRKVKIIVLISHMGLNKDQEIAESIPQIDLILGGHSHSILKEPVKTNNTWICQTGTGSQYLGVVKMKTDDNGYLSDVVSRLQPVDGNVYLPDKKVESIVKGYADELEKELSQVVGIAPKPLYKGVRGGKSPMARILAQSFRESVNADIGIMNIGGARKGIPAGEVTLKHLRTAAPFGNFVVKLHMKGKDVRKIIEAGVNQPFAPIPESKEELVLSRGISDLSGLIPIGENHGFIVCDGLTYIFNPQLKPGQRIISITIGGKSLDDRKTYSIGTNDFLAGGGDGFKAFQNYILRENQEFVDSEALRRWCIKRDILVAPQEHSVVNLSFDSMKNIPREKLSLGY